jgi:hypothetical protein
MEIGGTSGNGDEGPFHDTFEKDSLHLAGVLCITAKEYGSVRNTGGDVLIDLIGSDLSLAKDSAASVGGSTSINEDIFLLSGAGVENPALEFLDRSPSGATCPFCGAPCWRLLCSFDILCSPA